MKRIKVILLIVFCSFILFCCKNSAEKDKQISTDLITAKTLGLAYLEEFQLEEAEVQFQKFIKLAPEEKLGYANLGLVYLRMAKYPEAEKQLLKGIKIDPKDPDIRLILATVYRMQDNPKGAITQLKEALLASPGHIKVLYELTEIYATQSDAEALEKRESYMHELVGKTPGNIVPQLNLTDMYIRKGNFDAVIELLENIQKQYPEFPKEAVAYYNKAIADLKKSDQENAIIQFTIFHNYLKVTSPYQAGIMDLKGPGGSLIGFPLITFDQQSALNTLETGASLEVIQYVDVTSSAGLDLVPVNAELMNADNPYITHVETSDFDSDGDIDLYMGSFDQASSTYKHYLFSNTMGRFTDITREAGLKHAGREYDASFADYDNDGFLDLYVMQEGGELLYRNAGKGTFEDVTKKSGIGGKGAGNKTLFVDMDHDGDLDILKLRSGSNQVFRNNADGTFLEQAAKMGIDGETSNLDAAFGDFDEDGDLDLAVAHESGNITLYSNQRQGVFKDISATSGLISSSGSGTIAVGDYNNDGFLDILVASVKGGDHTLFNNLHNGSFERVKESTQVFKAYQLLKVYDAAFLDFDNDGYQDLLMVGEPSDNNTRGIALLHNNGKGSFTDLSEKIPATIKGGRRISLFDYNDDGDLDILIGGLQGGVSLLRNDGGNNNHFIKMKLVGLKAGSAKNNHFGIGAKIEVRSGELYQTMVVTDPNVHFGLGGHKQADVVRITWTNGVPQNIFMPTSNQALIEAQTLKGSCPFLYTWNGDEYVFVKDVLWRSALGMPLGIMGGTTAYGFADASDDYLKIPGEMLKPRKGKYSLQLTSELWETIYFDEVELVAVDHPATVDVYVPEQFSPPPFPGMKIFQVREKQLPVSAVDSKGNDVLPLINKKDDVYLAGYSPDKYQGITEMKHVILDPGPAGKNGKLQIFLNGWIFPTDASINVALSQTDKLKVFQPVIQVINKNGTWQTAIDNLGFPMGKDKTVVADLTGIFLCSDHRIRIVTNMDIYWDYIFFSTGEADETLVTTVLQPESADLHYRGFSRSYRKGGRYGPHWFDYAHVEKGPKWRDLTGNYTHYGNVHPLLTESDNQYIISNAGDEITVEFDAGKLPVLPKGWKRDFLIRSVGWVKDGDLNTAFGQTVEPLPYHGMKSYPPGPQEFYPTDPKLIRYHREYNTRIITREGYLNALKEEN